MHPNSLANLRPPFETGNRVNPGGKAVGTRNALTTKFLKDLLADYELGGKQAIQALREKSPDRYIAIIASLLPKEATLKLDTTALDELTAPQLSALVDGLERLIAIAGTSENIIDAEEVSAEPQ